MTAWGFLKSSSRPLTLEQNVSYGFFYPKVYECLARVVYLHGSKIRIQRGNLLKVWWVCVEPAETHVLLLLRFIGSRTGYIGCQRGL